MTKVLVYSGDTVGRRMSSAGIRCYELARALSAHFDVTLMAPGDLGGIDDSGLDVRPPPAHHRELLGFDAVLAQSLPPAAMRSLAASKTNVVYDLYIPVIHEAQSSLAVDSSATGRAYARAAKLDLRLALRTGNAFICASERQRDLLLGSLAALGRLTLEAYQADTTLRNLVDVVPFGIPDTPMPRNSAPLPGIEEDDRVLIWAGGIPNWFDPLTPIRAMANVSKARPDAKLVFVSRYLPDGRPTVMAERAVELARSLDLLDEAVVFNESWIPYAERHRYLATADLAVSAHYDDVEARYAFRTRLLDHFWAELPTITTQGDVLGDLVAERGLGVALPPRDVDGWAATILALLDDDRRREEIRARIASIRPDFEWPRVVEPLVGLLRVPGVAVPFRAPGERAAAIASRAEIALRLRAAKLRTPRGAL